MKKRYSVAILMIVLALVVFACGKNDAGQADDTKGSKITIWAWDPNFNIAIMKEAAEIYKQKKPDAEIEIVDFAKGDLEQKLHTMLASGTTNGLPDIVLIEDYNSQKYIQSYPGSFAKLTQSIDYSKFAPYKVALMTYDGDTYGVPFDSGVSGFYYRRDYLKDAGFTPEDLDNITWDRYIEIGETVFERTGKQMIATDPNDGGLIRVMLNGGASWYFDQQGNSAITNNPALADSLRVYADIINSPMTKKTSGWGEWVGALNSGDVASVVTGVWITGSVKAEASQSGLWGVAPTPRLNVDGAVNASNLGGSSWYVLDTSKSKNTAIDFLKIIYAGDSDFYQKILIDRGAVGSYLPAATGEAYSKADEFFGGQAVFSDFASWMANIPPLNYGLYTYEADAAIMAQMPSVYNGGSVEDALKAAESQLASQIQ